MTRIKAFDHLNAPLEGTNLIEASAGTGKTYTITGLYLRLVLEKHFSVNEILVVTFTEAATEELKNRIRNKIREAIETFSGGRSEDRLLNDLAEKHRNSKNALRYLIEAVRDFDKAAIFTIHGFCRKMLYENAFESGSLFDTELVADQESIKKEIVDDFWRTHFYNASPLFVNFAINNKFTPESLLSLLGNNVFHPYMKIIPQCEIPDSYSQEKDFRDYFRKVCDAWKSARTEVENIFATDEGLNRKRYRKATIPDWIRSMDDYVATDGIDPGLMKNFEKFTLSELTRAVKKNYSPPDHYFFELCEKMKEKQEELEKIFEQQLLGLKTALFHYAHNELDRRKKEKNVQFFDDLLLKLHRALKGKGGGVLASAMRKKFRAALIDEFQDTDPIQYAIFKEVFDNPNNILFLIGDPKQAIYSFRGADIFAYMKAARHVEFRHTLDENWRSEPDLITAINCIFTNTNHHFIYDQIRFLQATPATKMEPAFLTIEGQSEPPLQLWLLDARKVTGPGKEITKTHAREIIPRAVAAEISRLLNLGRNNKALLGKHPLREGDIAVLVRTNDEARMIQEALSALDIPGVLCSTGNLFDSHEALEMERILGSISEPNHENLLKAALATDMMGVKGEELDGLMKDETGWEAWLVKFKAYHDLWNEHGFVRMFRYLLLEEQIMTRLMSMPDGERRTTNVLHLSEVLHQASVERKLGMAGLLKWLYEQRDPGTPRLEEHQLRLESDENAVRIVTIHKSKGLEYPVVFCPFAWAGSRIPRAHPFTFHDEDDNMRLTLDLGSADMMRNLMVAEKERLAEDLRLLYVALTRAKNRCYLVWGHFKETGASALAYLFHQPGSTKGGNVVSATGGRSGDLRDEDVLKELKAVTAITEKAEGAIRLAEMPTEAGKKISPSPGKVMKLACRKFSGKIDSSWHISSFSSLLSGQSHWAEMADRDTEILSIPHNQTIHEEAIAGEIFSDIFSFPRGTKAGILLHDIFEHLDFAQEDASPMEKLVSEKLKESGFELTWRETLCNMIKKVLSVPLDPQRKDFSLSCIRNKDRLNEVEFYFPLQSISPKKLKSIFADYACADRTVHFPERIGRLHFAPVKGFMKGFIDMVFQFEGRFYLVDWKSNFLGNRVEDYGQAALSAVMEESYYILQFCIYTVALSQYLRLRLPDYNYTSHFGGVFYIFLRGVDPEKGPEYGVYRAKPPEEFLSALIRDLITQP